MVNMIDPKPASVSLPCLIQLTSPQQNNPNTTINPRVQALSNAFQSLRFTAPVPHLLHHAVFPPIHQHSADTAPQVPPPHPRIPTRRQPLKQPRRRSLRSDFVVRTEQSKPIPLASQPTTAQAPRYKQKLLRTTVPCRTHSGEVSAVTSPLRTDVSFSLPPHSGTSYPAW